MATPILTPSTKTVVGKFYMVPCVKLWHGKDGAPLYGRHRMEDAHGWVPVIGPEHHDRDTINFKPMHFHVDIRFVKQASLMGRVTRYAGWSAEQDAMTLPVSTYSDGVCDSPIKFTRELRRLQCKRDMPDFPSAKHSEVWRDFEKQHAPCKLKPGNICPHRGIDLTPFIKEDGTVICPGHGLRFDTKSGCLLPHHAAAL